MIYAGTRRLIGTSVVGLLAIASCLAIRWVWRDITYWSRSDTVAYKNSTLEDCVKIATVDWPGVTAVFKDSTISLVVPDQEGVIVKDTPTPQLARVVIFGHSRSISHLGPESEESVKATLHQLTEGLAARCGSAS